tara:strand:+ start:8065 stop:9273 length:1209 start_codon:yes stop_codon:yes gene_type:complete
LSTVLITLPVGFAYYAKYFTTAKDCSATPLNCPIALAEDPITGKDLLTSGAWTYETFHMKPVDASALTVSYDGTCGPEKGTKCSTGCCSQYGNCGTSPEHCSGACQHAFGTGCTDADVAGSWQNALKHGVTDVKAGGQYYFDAANLLFWTWDTPELIERKFEQIVAKYGLGGVMAWSLGEDSADWSHIKAMNAGLQRLNSNYATPTPGKHSNPMQPATAPSPPAEYESGPVDGEAPAIENPSSTPAPAEYSDPSVPYDVVWVDGTKEGPNGDYSTESGAPEDYVYHHQEENTSVVPQQQTPQQETASTPQQYGPIEPIPQPAPVPQTAPVQQDTAPASLEDDLPFSPEYEAALRAFGGGEASVPASGASEPLYAEPVVTDAKPLATGRACRLKRKKRAALKA